MQTAVAAAEEEQRVQPRLKGRLLYLADQDEMVTAVVDCVVTAFEYRKRVEQYGHAMFSHAPGRAAEPVLDPGRKGDRGRLLLGLQHVDREMPSLAQRRGAGGRLGDTDQQQGRIETQGSEAVRRQADRPLAVKARDHRRCGRDTAKRVAQGARVG